MNEPSLTLNIIVSHKLHSKNVQMPTMNCNYMRLNIKNIDPICSKNALNHSESNWNKSKAKTNSEQYYTTMLSLFWLLLNSLHLDGIKTLLTRFFSTNYEKVCGLCEIRIEYCWLELYELKPKMMKNFLHHLHVNYQHNAKTPLNYSKRTCV